MRVTLATGRTKPSSLGWSRVERVGLVFCFLSVRFLVQPKAWSRVEGGKGLD